jgi:hypothetical protein
MERGDAGPPRSRPPVRPGEVLAQFEAAIAGMRPRDIQTALHQLCAPGPAAPAPADVLTAEPDGLPAPLKELLGSIKAPAAARQLLRLIREAGPGQPVRITPQAAARMTRPYGWLLDRAGVAGLKLTDAGHLPPAHVQAAAAELGLSGQRGGTSGGTSGGTPRRESQSLPVRHLRESAISMGLLRKDLGRLMPTARGAALRSDPEALWWHLAERMPVPSPAPCEVQAGLVLLVCAAARFTDTLDETIARMLFAAGWASAGGTPLTGTEADRAAWATRTVLRHLGAFSGAPCPDHADRPTADGVTFARAALFTWPEPPVHLPEPPVHSPDRAASGRAGGTPPPSAAGPG